MMNDLTIHGSKRAYQATYSAATQRLLLLLPLLLKTTTRRIMVAARITGLGSL
jgi:hypothetical protein